MAQLRQGDERAPVDLLQLETVEGKRLRFLVLGSQIDAVDYMIERVETAGASRREGEFDREIVITGKTEAGFVAIPTILSLLMVVVTVMMLLAWNLPPILIAIPIIFELVTLAQILSLGLFYKVQIQKDGFITAPPLRRAVLPLQRHSGLPPRRVGSGSTAPGTTEEGSAKRTTFTI